MGSNFARAGHYLMNESDRRLSSAAAAAVVCLLPLAGTVPT
jgi:hypothetical protein